MDTIRPYYEHAGITIYHGDAREIVPQLGSGVIVSDPPYNVGYHYAGYSDNLSREDYQELLSVCLRVPSVVIHYPEDLVALSWTLEEIPAKMVAWVYPSNTARQWRGIAWFGIDPDFSRASQEYKNPNDKRIAERIAQGERARLYDWWQVNQVKNVSGEKTDHPCQIPISLMERILMITPSDTIIDPFMGSGSTLVAAKRLGRRAIGIEIDLRYCEIAKERLAQDCLYALEEPEASQGSLLET